MKKWVFLVCFLLILLIACTNEKESPATEQDTDHPLSANTSPEEKIRPFMKNPSTFHFIADWLSEDEIIIVEKEKQSYVIKSYHLKTGDLSTIYSDKSMIIDVLVHPTKQYLLVHTSERSDAAIVKLINLKGQVVEERTIHSTELAIEWHDEDPYAILLTAFAEDWSFDVYVWKGQETALQRLDIDHPFPKWLSTDKIVMLEIPDHALDGGTITIQHLNSGEKQKTTIDNALFVDTYGDTVFVAELAENDLRLTLRDEQIKVLYDWKVPAVSNYSEWVIPKMDWLSFDQIVIKENTEGGQLDELVQPYQLTKIEKGKQKVIVSEIDDEPFTCTPSGEKCLNGYTLETLIDMRNGKVVRWVEEQTNE